MATLGNKRTPYPVLGLIGHRGLVVICSELTIGASGAITAQPYSGVGGAVAVKTAATNGRYTFTIGAWKHFLGADVELVGPTTAIWGANTVGGPNWFTRNNNVDRGTKAGTIDLQFSASLDNSDADVPSGTIIFVTFQVTTGN